MIGKFIVIEGTDGSGKTEQFKLLRDHFLKDGYTVQTFDFPQYDRESSFFVREYLNGAYGGWKDVGAKRASIFYGLDRFDASLRIRTAINDGQIALSNRYTGSNLGHQGAKISPNERKDFFEWVYNLEFNTLGNPKPDLSVILHVPAEISFDLISGKEDRSYIKKGKRDLHEGDMDHLRLAEESYLQVANMWPNDFKVVECVEGGRLLSISEIHEKVWGIIKSEMHN